MNYLDSIISQLLYYKSLAEKTFEQLPGEKLFWQYNEECNSVAGIVAHMSGNMISRWTSFLTTDGEKPWRNRDAEFENNTTNQEEMLQAWDAGWQVCLDSLQALREQDLASIVYIRRQPHTVTEAINRQLAHYAYHVGQIVFLGKMYAERWNSLSIPRGNRRSLMPRDCRNQSQPNRQQSILYNIQIPRLC